MNGASLKPIGPIAPNWAPAMELSTLGCASTHCRFYREQHFGPTPPKAGPDYDNTSDINYIWAQTIFFLISQPIFEKQKRFKN